MVITTRFPLADSALRNWEVEHAAGGRMQKAVALGFLMLACSPRVPACQRVNYLTREAS
jgi:hypothetical protein